MIFANYFCFCSQYKSNHPTQTIVLFYYKWKQWTLTKKQLLSKLFYFIVCVLCLANVRWNFVKGVCVLWHAVVHTSTSSSCIWREKSFGKISLLFTRHLFILITENHKQMWARTLLLYGNIRETKWSRNMTSISMNFYVDIVMFPKYFET